MRLIIAPNTPSRDDDYAKFIVTRPPGELDDGKWIIHAFPIAKQHADFFRDRIRETAENEVVAAGAIYRVVDDVDIAFEADSLEKTSQVDSRGMGKGLDFEAMGGVEAVRGKINAALKENRQRFWR